MDQYDTETESNFEWSVSLVQFKYFQRILTVERNQISVVNLVI